MLKAATAAATNASTVTASTGWKWAAVAIGAGVVVIAYLLAAFVERTLSPLQVFKKLVEGADGVSSTSKFQWLLWLVPVVFAYVVLWVLRAHAGNYSAIDAIPANIMIVLGFSTGTMVIAKGIRANSVAGGGTPTVAPNAGSATLSQGLFGDDTGTSDLSKVQMLTFTTIAVGIFLAALIKQVTSTHISTALPNIDSSLLVLMGISQGGYLGKKLVTTASPALYPLPPIVYRPGTTMTVTGFSLGSTQDGSTFLANDVQAAVTNWSDTAITFTVPDAKPDRKPWQPGDNSLRLSAVVNGQSTNEVEFTVVLARLNPILGDPVQPGGDVTLEGTNLGPGGVGSVLLMDEAPIQVNAWTDKAITFNVPSPQPGGNPWPNGVTQTQLTVAINGQSSNPVPLRVQGP